MKLKRPGLNKKGKLVKKLWRLLPVFIIGLIVRFVEVRIYIKAAES